MVFVGKGARPVRSTECTAQVVATQKCIALQDGVFTPEIHVTRQQTSHSHPVSERIWHAYAENRRVDDLEIVSMVRRFVGAGTALDKSTVMSQNTLVLYYASGLEL